MKKTRKRVHRAVSRRSIKKEKRQYRDLEKQMRDPLLRSRWRNRDSIKKNYAKVSMADYQHKLADDAELQLPSEPKRLSEQQLIILHNLYEKHRDDCEAMRRDVRLNVYQWTTTQCSRFLQLYKALHVSTTAKQYILPSLKAVSCGSVSTPPLPAAKAAPGRAAASSSPAVPRTSIESATGGAPSAKAGSFSKSVAVSAVKKCRRGNRERKEMQM